MTSFSTDKVDLYCYAKGVANHGSGVKSYFFFFATAIDKAKAIVPSIQCPYSGIRDKS